VLQVHAARVPAGAEPLRGSFHGANLVQPQDLPTLMRKALALV
jgi:hypothetical protein